jgi:hypothetical protein
MQGVIPVTIITIVIVIVIGNSFLKLNLKDNRR